LATRLLQHRLQYLVEGVGSGAKQHHEEIELQRELPVFESDQGRKRPCKHGQSGYRGDHQGEAQPQRIAQERPQCVGEMLRVDLGHEAGQDLPGSHRRNRQDQVDQREEHRVGGEFAHREAADDQHQRADARDRSQRLAHQEVLHARGNARCAVGIGIAAGHVCRLARPPAAVAQD
jgi:hypothetical protein